MTRRSRYGVKGVWVGDVKLDSKAEAKRYGELLLLEKAGEIINLKVHPRYALSIAGITLKSRSQRYPNGRVLYYVADFSYTEYGRQVIEDVKMASGHRTETYRLKKAIMEAMGHTITEI